MWRLVFNSVHNLAHPGIRTTRRMLTSRFVWTSCSSDVNTWCRECQQCARAKIQPQERAAVDAIPVPLHKFSHVHMDLVGPWPRTAEGHTHLLTIVDRTTRWADAIPLQSTTAQVVAVLVLLFILVLAVSMLNVLGLALRRLPTTGYENSVLTATDSCAS